jgi:hypothetical protein
VCSLREQSFLPLSAGVRDQNSPTPQLILTLCIAYNNLDNRSKVPAELDGFGGQGVWVPFFALQASQGKQGTANTLAKQAVSLAKQKAIQFWLKIPNPKLQKNPNDQSSYGPNLFGTLDIGI